METSTSFTMLHAQIQPSSSSYFAYEPDGTTVFAEFLGYVIGLGSLFLYSPIAVRLIRQRSANGLTMSTWWLQLVSFTLTDIYAFTHGYPISAYVETVTNTMQVSVVLGLTAHYQNRMYTKRFRLGVVAYSIGTSSLLLFAPRDIIAAGQVVAVGLNSGALLPQFYLNHQRQSAGDYSPVTTVLAAIGCSIRLFTTFALADSDPLLMGSFALCFFLNVGLLSQILYLGTQVEGRSIQQVLFADITSTDESIQANRVPSNRSINYDDELDLQSTSDMSRPLIDEDEEQNTT